MRKSDLCSFVSEGVVNTAQAAQILNCTRQNIDNLMKRGKLKPVKEMANDKLFLKSDILKRV
ncbi:MAG: helix-turn-helix domain-containing protein [Clostridiales bacterium]|nr:helix-turn-helix domain-containing protein [Clostridiales bacterium]